ncbi:hypothetical protein AYO41_00335 [Verrucomicrobia bacterium SCGC AG-212-E04]|nr:hypothetical protein AYO41_00335 [Verrucomicrobia bacterium SCGC AG-212-E04]
MREHPVWRGLAILLASLLGHVVCFFLLQVSYPPTISRPPVPARIYLPAPGSEEARLVAMWAEVEDPSRMLISPEPPPGRVLDMLRANPYRPSFADYEPALLPGAALATPKP